MFYEVGVKCLTVMLETNQCAHVLLTGVRLCIFQMPLKCEQIPLKCEQVIKEIPLFKAWP